MQRLLATTSILTAVILIGALFFAIYHTTSAQFDLKMTRFSDPETIQLRPPFPSPGETVTATLISPNDLKSSYIIWSVDGTVVQQSNNGVSYTFTAKNAGVRTSLVATASGGSSPSIVVTKDFFINNVILLWEAKTYTPPLYPGRALLGPGGEATVVVVPTIYTATGGIYDPNVLMYTWRVDANATPLTEGLGITSVTVKNDQLFKPVRVSVNIADTQGIVLATKFIEIPIIQPKIILYEDSRLSGTRYANALRGEYSLTTAEVTLIAEPYFMSAKKRDDETLSYAWQIGSLTQGNSGSIVLRPEGVGGGRAGLSLVVTNKSYLAQRIRGELSILFTSQASTKSANPNTTPL